MGILDKVYAFIYLRGFRVWLTYRTNVVLTVISWIIPVFTYFFVGTSLGNRIVTSIGVTNYTAFFVIGLAFQGYVSSIISTISQRLRNEQLYGTIEYYVIAKTGVSGFLVYSAVWGFTLNSLSAVVILTVGYLLGVRYAINWIATILLVVVLMASTLGISMMAGAVTMITKQGNPVSIFFSTFTSLIAGTLFPISVLPLAVRYISYVIPLTWGLLGLRETMLANASLSQVLPYIERLSLLAIVYIIIGVSSYSYAFKLARKRGTLAEY
ncbi:ABC transporter [Sulfolobales archaeon HS-7]|nr:ABC transporter [Sulfolobales archaeon HS-7]